MNDTIIVQQAEGLHMALLFIAQGVHYKYTQKWSMDYSLIGGTPQRPEEARYPIHSWYKVWAMKRFFREGYKNVIWLDADALIVDHSVDLREACVPGTIGATWHSLPEFVQWGVYDHFNMGVLYASEKDGIIKCLCDAWYNTPTDHQWNEQHVYNKILPERWGKYQRELPHKWNATPPNFDVPDAVVRAWHGYGGPEQRLYAMLQEMTIRGL